VAEVCDWQGSVYLQQGILTDLHVS
jgi:hypothetical protein